MTQEQSKESPQSAPPRSPSDIEKEIGQSLMKVGELAVNKKLLEQEMDALSMKAVQLSNELKYIQNVLKDASKAQAATEVSAAS